jgi:hypothetical protein
VADMPVVDTAAAGATVAADTAASAKCVQYSRYRCSQIESPALTSGAFLFGPSG